MTASQNMKLYTYRGIVTRVVDGDTLYVVIDLGFHITITQLVRLADIDTPEIFRPKTPEELRLGRAAKARVEALTLGKEITIKTYKTGKYGRWLATIMIDGRACTLSETLKDEGFEK